MAEVLVDTSGWASWLVRDQPAHAAAANLMRQWRTESTRLVTTNLILSELAALLTSPLRISRPLQIAFLVDLRAARWVEIVHVDPDLDTAGWKLFMTRPDKSWSHVDCVSFVLMERRGIREALTTDRHFEQAGFVRLLP